MQATKTAAKEPVREMAHILVVDDERSICELLEITFRKEGHRVELANNVESAKRKLESQIFDIVISDVRMPGEGGVDLLKFTKEICAGYVFSAGYRSTDSGHGDCRDQCRRGPLRDQGSRAGGSVAACGTQRYREPEMEKRSRLSEKGTAPADRTRQHHRAESPRCGRFSI